jgi:uncharacterized protein (TIGR02266 family)
MSNGKDSRRDPRAKVLAMTVRYKSATVAEFMENHSYDVSRGGFFIKTPSPFPPGTLLKFEVRIAEEQKVMMGVGRVTWKRDVDSGPEKPAGMGVKFIKLDDESTRMIGELIEKREGAEAGFEEGARESGVTVSAPPPPPVESRSDPDKSVIAHTADILRSALDAARTPSGKPAAGEDDDRSTLPTSVPTSSVRKPSAPPRPTTSRAPLPPSSSSDTLLAQASPPAEVAELPAAAASGAKDGKSDSGDAPSDQPLPDSGAEAAGISNAEETVGKGKDAPKAVTAARATDGAKGEALPIAAMTTTPPRRSHVQPAQTPRAASRAIWIFLALGLVVAGYYFFTRDDGSTKLESELPVEPKAAPSSEPVAEQPSAPVAEPAETEAPSATGSSETLDAAPSASASASATPEVSAAPSAEEVPRPVPKRPRAPRPVAPRPSVPPAAPAPTAAAPVAPPPETPKQVEPSPAPAPAPPSTAG